MKIWFFFFVMAKCLLLAFGLFALFGVNICFYVEWVRFTSLVLAELCVSFGGLCLFIFSRWTLLLSVLLALYALRACGDTGWFPDRLQNRDLLILMISLSLMKAQQRSLLAFIMSAALCTVCPKQRGCSQKTWVCSLCCFFPSSVLPSYRIVFLSPLICVSSWDTEPSETFCAKLHTIICSSCHFINCRCPGSKDMFQSPCPVQICNITE